jgi:fumarate hydratase class II
MQAPDREADMTNERIEKDTFGDIAVAADRLWGAQTQRSLHHFDISTERMPDELIWALAMVKRSAAVVNRELGCARCPQGRRDRHAADES